MLEIKNLILIKHFRDKHNYAKMIFTIVNLDITMTYCDMVLPTSVTDSILRKCMN